MLTGVVQETPTVTQAIDTALDNLPELEGKTVLLKTEHTSESGIGAAKLELTWKAVPLKASSHSLAEHYTAAKGEQQSMIRHQL